MNLHAREVHVVAYSGYKANERPLYLILGGQKLEIKEVLDRWYGQEHDYFKVLMEDDQSYLLKWHRKLDLWFIVGKGRRRLGAH